MAHPDEIDLPGEIWKPDRLAGLDELEVSSLARIRRKARMVWTAYDEHPHFKQIRTRILKQWVDAKGYAKVSISITGKTHGFLVHRMVCAAFHGLPPDGKRSACHNNGDVRNNRPENLRWGSAKDNMADKKIHGTDNTGARHPRAKLDDLKIKAIKMLRGAGMPNFEIAMIFGVAEGNTSAIYHGKIWSHLADDPIPERLK